MNFEAALQEEKRKPAKKAEPVQEEAPGISLIKLDVATVKPDFAKYEVEIARWEQETGAMEVKDQPTQNHAVIIGGAVAKLRKAIDARRKEVIADAEAFVKGVNNFCKGFTERLKKIEDTTKQKISRYQELQEMTRREAEKKAQEEARKLQEQIDKEAQEKGIEPIKVDAPIIAPQPTTVRTDTGTTCYTMKHWVCEVYDASAVPREFCSPDQKKLDEAVKSGARAIPGCSIFEKTGTRFRT